MEESNRSVPLEEAVEDLIKTQATVERRALRKELDELNARAATNRATLQQQRTATEEYRATIQEHQAIIESIKGAIRDIEEQSGLLERQNRADEPRRAEISHALEPGVLENQIKRLVSALTRSTPVDQTTHSTTQGTRAANATNREPQPRLERIQEEPEEHDHFSEHQSVRRSARNRAPRSYDEPRLSSPAPDMYTQVVDSIEVQRDSLGQKRSLPAQDERQTTAGSQKKKRKGMASSGTLVSRKAPRTIEYDEVFAGGNAVIKYKIVEYPKESNQWYILRCLRHKKHFFGNALPAATRHIHTGTMSHRLPNTREAAIRELGVRVLNCDADKAKQNNLAVDKAADSGYRGPPAVQSSKRNVQSARPDQPRVHGHVVVNPIVGEIYNTTSALVVVLPLTDLSSVGMSGPPITDLGLDLPSCYLFRKTEGVWDWEHHSKAGSDRVHNRKYPVMVFQENMAIPPYPEPLRLPPGLEHYDFLRARQLEPVNLDDPEHQYTQGIGAAKAFRARIHAVREITSRSDGRSDDATRQDDHGSDQENDLDPGDEINMDDDDDDDDETWNGVDSSEDDDDEDGDDNDDDDDTINGENEAAHTNTDGASSHERLGSSNDQAHPGPAQAVYHDQESSIGRGGPQVPVVPREPTIPVGGGHDITGNAASRQASSITQRPEGTSQGRSQPGSSNSVQTPLEASGANAMTTAELQEYLSELIPTDQQHDQVDPSPPEPGPVKSEPTTNHPATSPPTIGNNPHNTTRPHEPVQAHQDTMDIDRLPTVDRTGGHGSSSLPYLDADDNHNHQEEHSSSGYQFNLHTSSASQQPPRSAEDHFVPTVADPNEPIGPSSFYGFGPSPASNPITIPVVEHRRWSYRSVQWPTVTR